MLSTAWQAVRAGAETLRQYRLAMVTAEALENGEHPLLALAEGDELLVAGGCAPQAARRRGTKSTAASG